MLFRCKEVETSLLGAGNAPLRRLSAFLKKSVGGSSRKGFRAQTYFCSPAEVFFFVVLCSFVMKGSGHQAKKLLGTEDTKTAQKGGLCPSLSVRGLFRVCSDAHRTLTGRWSRCACTYPSRRRWKRGKRASVRGTCVQSRARHLETAK